MDLIFTFFSIVGAALASIVAHIVAHDFCAATPSLSKRMIARAVSRLTPDLRERYQEEWLADLAERQTVYEKFRHAFDCLFMARKIAYQADMTRIEVSFILPTVGRIPTIFNVRKSRPIPTIFRGVNSNNATLKRVSVTGVAFYFFMSVMLSARRQLDRATFKRFAKAFPDLFDGTKSDYQVKLLRNNSEPFDLTRLTKLFISHPKEVSTYLANIKKPQ